MIIQKNASILRHVHTEVHRDKGASCLRLTLKWFWRMMRWRWPLGWRTHRKLGEKYMDFLVLPFEIFFWLQKSSWIYSLSIQQDFFFQLTVFSWILLEADTEPRIWVCVVYLGCDPNKHLALWEMLKEVLQRKGKWSGP